MVIITSTTIISTTTISTTMMIMMTMVIVMIMMVMMIAENQEILRGCHLHNIFFPSPSKRWLQLTLLWVDFTSDVGQHLSTISGKSR